MSSTSIDEVRPAAMAPHVPLWLWPALGTMALLLVVGHNLLNDPDTYWQIAMGNWIVANDSFPRTDLFSLTMKDQPWISTSWAAQVAYALAYRFFGWTGPVLLAALAAATAIALIARFMLQRIAVMPAMMFSIAALVLAMPHMVARPHVLALPLMVLWAGTLIAAADRREAPSFWLLPVITVWTNVHGSFVLGLALIGVMAVDAIWNSHAGERKALAMRWGAFGVLAVIASCVTPYGYNSLFAAWKILTLGDALPMIVEWRPMDFAKLGPFEIVLLACIGLVLWRGVTLPPLRIAMLLGLVHLALSSVRHADAFAMLAPLLLAAPLAAHAGGPEREKQDGASSAVIRAGMAALLIGGIGFLLATQRYAPPANSTPAAAVAALKQHKAQRVFNDYHFGGYMIASGLSPFIDGRTELYGAKMMVAHDSATSLRDPADLFRMLDQNRIDATLLMPTTPAAKLLDRTDGWQRLFADDIAVVHVRKPAAPPPQPAAAAAKPAAKK